MKIECTVFKLEDDRLLIATKIQDLITRSIMDLRNEAVREALIKLGWTPPGEKMSKFIESCDRKENSLSSAFKNITGSHEQHR